MTATNTDENPAHRLKTQISDPKVREHIKKIVDMPHPEAKRTEKKKAKKRYF